MSAVPIKTPGRFFYGWVIVAVSFLCWLVADAFGFYTFGLFLGPIHNELGWDTVHITFAMTLRTIVAGLIGPLIGYLADKKYGARLLMPGGVLAAGAATILVSTMDSLWQFYFFYGVIGALGMVGFGGLVTHTIIAKWFIRKRGRAMAIATLGVSISGVIFVPLNHFLISAFGWRNALMICGLLIWAIALLPVALFVRRAPEDVGLRPDGDQPYLHEDTDGESSQPVLFEADEYSWTLGQALRTKTLWLLLAAFNITGVSIGGVMIHFYPFMEIKGISSNVAASALTIFALACASVKIPWGILAERLPVRYCIIAVYAGSAMGLAILLSSASGVAVYSFAVIYGFAQGGMMVLREVLFADYYGRAFLGAIRGVVMPLNLVSMAGGPIFAAWIRDVTGSYTLAYSIFLSTFVFGVFFMILAKPPSPPDE